MEVPWYLFVLAMNLGIVLSVLFVKSVIWAQDYLLKKPAWVAWVAGILVMNLIFISVSVGVAEYKKHDHTFVDASMCLRSCDDND